MHIWLLILTLHMPANDGIDINTGALVMDTAGGGFKQVVLMSIKTRVTCEAVRGGVMLGDIIVGATCVEK